MSTLNNDVPASVPMNEIAHVNVDNLGFVLNLRSETIKVRGTKLPPNSHHLVGRKEKATKLISTSSVCRNPLCLFDVQEMAQQISEKEELLQRLRNLQDLLVEEEEMKGNQEKEYQNVAKKQENLQQKLITLDGDYNCLRDQLRGAMHEQKHLEKSISLAKASVSSEEGRAALLEKRQLLLGKKNQLKHNGLYSMQQTGQPIWSCCLNSEFEGPGCIEEHSVGLRSTLPQSKTTLNQNRSLPTSKGHELATLLHGQSTCSMQHMPPYAFWSTRKRTHEVKVTNNSSTSFQNINSTHHSPSLREGSGSWWQNNSPHISFALKNVSWVSHQQQELRRRSDSISNRDEHMQNSTFNEDSRNTGTSIHSYIRVSHIRPDGEVHSYKKEISGHIPFLSSCLKVSSNKVGTVRKKPHELFKKINRPLSSPTAFSTL